MIYSTIHEDIKDIISKTTLAHEAMNAIEAHFSHAGRSSQVATFINRIKQKFDSSQTSLLEHVADVTKDMNKLKSQGFVFTEDSIKGMFVQLGAPSEGPYKIMEDLNNRLDAKYRDNPGTISSTLVQLTMQNLLINRTTAIEASKSHAAMAARPNM